MDYYVPWGKSVSIDLFECSHALVSQPEPIKQFIQEIIKVIDMVAHGPCYVERFGIGELEGYSAMQFIETSSITVHCDEIRDRAFIDIFSCKEFNEDKALDFAKQFFHAKTWKINPLVR